MSCALCPNGVAAVVQFPGLRPLLSCLSLFSMQFESRGHLTLKEHKHRAHMEKANEVEILKSEGADLPHHTHAGHVDLPGAVD